MTANPPTLARSCSASSGSSEPPAPAHSATAAHAVHADHADHADRIALGTRHSTHERRPTEIGARDQLTVPSSNRVNLSGLGAE